MKSKVEIVSYEKRKVIKVYRVCFRKSSLMASDSLLKMPFLKKRNYLNLNKMCEKHIPIRQIQCQPTLLDCPSALLSNKGAFLQKQKALFQEYFDLVLSFWINKEF